MSRNRRNRGVTGGSLEPLNGEETPFGNADLQGMTTTELASAGYNSQIADFAGVGQGKVTAKPLDIDKIYPDPSQPRRTIPSTLRQYWDGQPNAESMRFLFKNWLKEIEVERSGRSFDLDAVLRGEVTERAEMDDDKDSEAADRKTDTGEKEAALLKIAQLAASIKRDGLTNPITVAARNGAYVIETGERRWFAYQLLRWHFNGDPAWFKIPAREVDNINIWRQASENNARADLSAIARARQLALLIMDIYREDYEFGVFDEFETEQAFYAQVADGGAFKVPTQKVEMLLNAMGLPNPVQIRQYRALLRLPGKVWTLADDFDWAENAIQKDLLQASGGDDDLMIQLAYEKAGILPDDGVSTLTPDGDDAGDFSEAVARTGSGKTRKSIRWMKQFSTLRTQLDTMLIQDRDKILDEIADILHTFRPDE